MLGDRAAAAAALLSYTAAVAALRETLEPKLRELELEPLYYDVELPLCAVLARMEQRGFLIDRAALAQFGETLQTSITQLEQQIYAAAGAPFNINSPEAAREGPLRGHASPARQKNQDRLEHKRGRAR